MLLNPKPGCVECGIPFDHPDFKNQSEDNDFYPAYWSDTGLLCSPKCSTQHYVRRAAEGTLPATPPPAHVNIYEFRD